MQQIQDLCHFINQQLGQNHSTVLLVNMILGMGTHISWYHSWYPLLSTILSSLSGRRQQQYTQKCSLYLAFFFTPLNGVIVCLSRHSIKCLHRDGWWYVIACRRRVNSTQWGCKNYSKYSTITSPLLNLHCQGNLPLLGTVASATLQFALCCILRDHHSASCQEPGYGLLFETVIQWLLYMIGNANMGSLWNFSPQWLLSFAMGALAHAWRQICNLSALLVLSVLLLSFGGLFCLFVKYLFQNCAYTVFKCSGVFLYALMNHLYLSQHAYSYPFP